MAWLQRGRHLDFSDAISAAVKTEEMRAAELEDTLKAFMFAIPKVPSATQRLGELSWGARTPEKSQQVCSTHLLWYVFGSCGMCLDC